jgi:hypothetical protein
LDQPRTTFWHEAGHALAALSNELPVNLITIDSWQSGRVDITTDGATDHIELQIALGGLMGEKQLYPNLTIEELGDQATADDDDMSKARQIILVNPTLSLSSVCDHLQTCFSTKAGQRFLSMTTEELRNSYRQGVPAQLSSEVISEIWDDAINV